ncbi:Hypothetical protein R9X50_00436200 [Acrodontium crateriforme]|uniref:Uncharacterized protein n=1 Tax=Acrodontium crateriforme TaxID=150365 RepID=A0AAQ3RA53_9PEZI|nr:Hypothetical protein R9X50_00436200 [Acrodontium crateriforme]
MSSILKLPGDTAEKLQSHTRLTSVSFTFIVPVPSKGGGAKYPEKFEWRQSRGAEVKSAASSKYTTGWKLVRLSNENATGVGGRRKDREIGETSDGKEVVAVWANYAKMSMTKVACFQFCGTGATGELGDEWTLMAVLSVLRLWQVTVED